MNKYINKLTGSIIETTEERYNDQFKEIGYEPYVEKKIEKPKKEK